MGGVVRVSAGLAVALLSWVGTARAEWQIRPAASLNLLQNTTIVGGDSTSDAGASRIGFGIAGALIGNVLGLEADLGRRSNFFPARPNNGGNVLGSGVTTLTGNVVIALPKRLAEYSLRPYFVGGAGLMAVRIDQKNPLFNVSLNMKAVDMGGGVTGFLTPRFGLNWDVRYFRNVGESLELPGQSLGPPALSFWRAQMALAIRY